MPHSLIVGNWKMTLGTEASRGLAEAIVPHCVGLKQTTVWLAPSFLSLRAVVDVARGSEVLVGSQNCHWESKGAFTGEVSPTEILGLGCGFTIIGHSERRFEIGESTELCAKRAHGALDHGLKVIFCIGETLQQRKDGATETVVKAQLAPFLHSLSVESRMQTILAYEPVWAIGTGLAATSKEIEETHALIDQVCRELMAGDSLPILYGGSVTPKNFSAVIHSKRVTGALIGSASISAESFLEMIELSEQS